MSSNSSEKEQQELPLPVADEAATNLRKHQSCHAQKLKTVLGILLIVGVVAAVGVCAAVFAPSKKNGKKGANEEFPDLQTREHLYKRMTAARQLSRKARGSRRGDRTEAITCRSEMSNDTIPAAHIAGKGLEWPTTEAPTALSGHNDDTPGYLTSWSCNQDRNGAFVDGGMVFNHTDRKLYVPKCGYYYVSSQVFYRVAQSQTRSVQHNIKVDRNCLLPGEDGHSRVVNQREFSLHTVTSIGAGNGRDRQDSSTYIGEIVKICTGGKIWVEIPQDTPCCPYGYNTYLGAYFVAETNCFWPLPHHNN